IPVKITLSDLPASMEYPTESSGNRCIDRSICEIALAENDADACRRQENQIHDPIAAEITVSNQLGAGRNSRYDGRRAERPVCFPFQSLTLPRIGSSDAVGVSVAAHICEQNRKRRVNASRPHG